MSSEALTVPWWSDPATRNKSSQLRHDQLGVHPGPRNAIQDPIVGRGIETPKARFADVSQPRAKLVAQQPKQSKHHVTDPGRIRHDFHRPQPRLVFQQAIEDVHRIAQRPGMTMAWKPVNWSEVKL